MALRKKKLLNDIDGMVEYSRVASSLHLKEVADMRNFIDLLQKLVEVECPEFLNKFSNIADIMKETLAQEEILADAELRLAEDLNDVAARFTVVFRVSNEFGACKMKVEECSANIDKIKVLIDEDSTKGGTKQYQLQAKMQQAIAEKKNAITATEDKLKEFIDVKEKYAAFKVRRMRHGYSYYGSKLTQTMASEAAIMQNLNNSIEEAKLGLNDTFASYQERKQAEANEETENKTEEQESNDY